MKKVFIVAILLFLMAPTIRTQSQLPYPPLIYHPDNLKVLSISRFEITIIWTYPAMDILYFRVEKKVGDKDFQLIASVTSTVGMYRDEDVVFSNTKKTYSYRVLACDHRVCSAPSNTLVVNYDTYNSMLPAQTSDLESETEEKVYLIGNRWVTEEVILNQKYSEGFQNLKWGMSSERVKTLIKKNNIQRINEGDDFAVLFYPDVIGKYPCKAELWFYKNHLYKAHLFLTPPGAGPKWKNQAWIAAYTGIANIIARRYGYSSDSAECESYIDMSEDGCWAAWETEETKINLSLHCEYSPELRTRVANLELFYSSKDIMAIVKTVSGKKVKAPPALPAE